MESTGKYWIPVFNLLEDEINVTNADITVGDKVENCVSLIG